MFSTCSELTPRAPIPDGRMAQIMQPCIATKQHVKGVSTVNKIGQQARQKPAEMENLMETKNRHPDVPCFTLHLWLDALVRVAR